MLRPTRDPGRPGRGFRIRGFHPLWPGFPAGSPNLSNATSRSRNPGKQAPRFGLLRFRSPLLAQSRLIYVPAGTEMFHFPASSLAGLSLFIPRRHPAKGAGFPHSEISGSKPVDGSPKLIAVFRVLHRLPMPRHPSCARIRLARNFSLSRCVVILFSLQLPVFKDRAALRGANGCIVYQILAHLRKGVFSKIFSKRQLQGARPT